MSRKYKYLAVIFFIGMIAFSITSYALVDKSQQWLPLSQIAVNWNSDTSVDENYNGIIDNAEKLNGYTDKDFIKTTGGTLKGALLLYYGIGKIIDLDNPQYYIDPSSKSNFKYLCLRGNCIKAWNDISSGVDEEYLRNLIVDQIHLIEKSLNVNSSMYAKNIEGINMQSLKEVLKLKDFCINGLCEKGINANSLMGHEIGSNISDIPVIDPSLIYENLKVGYAVLSSYANNTYYVGNMKAEDLVNSLSQTNSSINDLIIDVDSLKSSNRTLWTKIKEIEEELNNKDEIVLDALQDTSVKDALKNYLQNIGFLRVSSCQSNMENMIIITKGSDGKLIIRCKDTTTYISQKVKEHLKNKKCPNGVMIGFNDRGEKVCDSYTSMASKIITNGGLIDKLSQEGFVKVTSCNNNQVLIYENNRFQCIPKREIINDMFSCSSGVLVKTSSGYLCKSYYSLADSLIGNGGLIDKLEDHGVATKQWAENKFIEKPRCSNNEVLAYENGEYKCKELEPVVEIGLDDPRTWTGHIYTSETTIGGSDDEKYQFTCPEGYIMAGINVRYEDVNDNFGKSSVINEISLVCKRLTLLNAGVRLVD